MPRPYKIFDVFTDRPLTGNPLAVVLDADGLDEAAMQAIAREFNLSETTFVLPAENPAHSAAVRIFTPEQELPFAGHPTVGTAVCLAEERFDGPGEHDAVIVLEERIGAVRCGVRIVDGAGFAEFDCPKLPARKPLPLPSASRRPRSASKTMSRAFGRPAIRFIACRCATWACSPRPPSIGPSGAMRFPAPARLSSTRVRRKGTITASAPECLRQ
jgi:hypothetical protein